MFLIKKKKKKVTGSIFKALFFVYSKFIPSTAGYENNFLLEGTRLTVCVATCLGTVVHSVNQLCYSTLVKIWVQSAEKLSKIRYITPLVFLTVTGVSA